MAVLPVVQGDDDALRIISQEVNPFSQTLGELIDDLVETMHARNIASLSAVQCGIPLRIFVTDVLGDVQVWMNPVVLEQEGAQKSGESCASFPDLTLEIERPEHLTIEVRTTQNQREVRDCSGVLARLVAHELDHLDGTVAQDHLSEEAFYAQLLGTAFLTEDETPGNSADRRFDFLRDFHDGPSHETTPTLPNPAGAQGDGTPREDEDLTQILDLMADGTWKWVLALELLRDIVSDDEAQLHFEELEGVLSELTAVQEYWDGQLRVMDADDADDGSAESTQATGTIGATEGMEATDKIGATEEMEVTEGIQEIE